MTNITYDPPPSQTPEYETGPFPVMGYRLLSQQTLYAPAPENHDRMREIECRVAKRILAWVTTTPHHPQYADYLRDLKECHVGNAFMGQLCFALYRHTDAASWLKWEDANGSSSYLWQQAVLTAARQLNAQ